MVPASGSSPRRPGLAPVTALTLLRADRLPRPRADGSAALGLSWLRWRCAPRRSGQAQGCGVVALLAQAVTVLRHHHLTVHSSRTGFASRLNSGVSWHDWIAANLEHRGSASQSPRQLPPSCDPTQRLRSETPQTIFDVLPTVPASVQAPPTHFQQSVFSTFRSPY